MTAQPMDAACRAFARSLPDHVRAARNGELPQHAAGCAACGRRLELAQRLAVALGTPPAVPAASRGRAALDAVYERAAAGLAADPIGRLVGAALAEPPSLPEVPWPLQHDELGLGERLATPPAAAPVWLWARVREQVREQVGRTGRRRAALAGAAGLAAALLATLVLLGRRETSGTPPEVTIVFQNVDRMPLVDHPTAVLRRAGGR